MKDEKKMRMVAVAVPLEDYEEYVKMVKLFTNERLMGYNEKVFLKTIQEETQRLKKKGLASLPT